MRRAPKCVGWLALAAAAGCAHGGMNGSTAQRSGATAIMLQIENRSWHDVDIYLARGGMTTRLGTVTATAAHTFPAAPYLVRSSFQLICRVIGSDASITTENITVRPGQYVQWTLGNDIQYSSLSVWSADST
jgi:hypothetical protein